MTTSKACRGTEPRLEVPVDVKKLKHGEVYWMRAGGEKVRAVYLTGRPSSYWLLLWSLNKGHNKTANEQTCSDYTDYAVRLPGKPVGKVTAARWIGFTPVVVWKGRIFAGCTELTARQSHALFRVIGEALGYEVTG